MREVFGLLLTAGRQGELRGSDVCPQGRKHHIKERKTKGMRKEEDAMKEVGGGRILVLVVLTRRYRCRRRCHVVVGARRS